MAKGKLKDYCLQITDGEHGTIPNDPSGEYYYLNNNNITQEGITIGEDDRRISKGSFDTIRKRTKLAKGDVVIATCGTLGKTRVIDNDPVNYEFSRSVGIIKPNPELISAEYIHYYFSLPSSQHRIMQIATGGVQKHFYISDMEDFVIDVPCLTKQCNTTSILSSLDDKIANNKKLMAELESTARLIYDYWFTQFDFPDENGNPYRSSGGAMVYNETLHREIPEGWEVGKLSDYVRLDRSLVEPEPMLQYEHYSIPAYDEFHYPVFEYGEEIASTKYSITPSAMLYSKLNPKYKRLWNPICITDLAICSTEFFVMYAKINEERPYCLSLLDSEQFYAHMASRAISSTGSRSRTDADAALGFTFAAPPHDVIRLFSKRVEAFYEQCRLLHVESYELSALRDWLLPMLMNGQVSIRANEMSVA